MIAYIKGNIVEIGENYVVVETGSGVGYKVQIPLSSEKWAGLEAGSEVTLYTSQYFRENDQGLFGFAMSEERNFFELLTTVSGVGPKLAMTLLAHLEHRELAGMILNEDVTGIVKVPGIGKKMAERLIVDLRDKVLGVEGATSGSVRSSGRGEFSEELDFLGQALGKLGFAGNEIKDMIDGAEEILRENENVEDVLKILLSRRER